MSGGGFATPNSVEGTLDANSDRQSEGALKGYLAWKEQLESSTGLAFGFDDQVQLLATNSDRSPADAMANVFRFYGVWTATGRGTPNNGAVVFKVENRSALGTDIAPQALGPALGYAGLLSATYSDADWILSNLSIGGIGFATVA